MAKWMALQHGFYQWLEDAYDYIPSALCATGWGRTTSATKRKAPASPRGKLPSGTKGLMPLKRLNSLHKGESPSVRSGRAF
jgi:hypothetical protein